MASLTRNAWKTDVETDQPEMTLAKAVSQARNYLNKAI
jgi:fructose-specific component phosphotransferase system IIB-like protein